MFQGELHPVPGGGRGAVRLVLHALQRGGARQHAALRHRRRHLPLLHRPLHHRPRPLPQVKLYLVQVKTLYQHILYIASG